MNSRKKNYLYITIFAAFLICLSFIYKISIITNLHNTISETMMSGKILVPAIVCAFIFTKSGIYWAAMLLCALADAVGIMLYQGSPLTDFQSIALIMISFLITIFLLNLIKVILTE